VPTATAYGDAVTKTVDQLLEEARTGGFQAWKAAGLPVG
jgi:hypothetical protein